MDESFDPQHLEMSGEEEELRTIDSEKDSGIYDPSTSEVKTDAKRTRNVGRRKVCISKCISDNKLVTMLILIVIGLVIIIIVMAAKGEKSCPIYPPVSWLGKYVYISKKQRNWLMSSNICSTLNASLIVIDTWKELEYWVTFLDPDDYWFGLSKKDQVWVWPNGTKFTNQFPVEGEGTCGYINGKGANSTICSMEKRFICSFLKLCCKAG